MNLNLVIDTSRFKPFEYYNAALQTMKDYGTQYEKQQAVYDKIAQTLGDLASAVEGSTKAKQMYDEYQGRFNDAANSFVNGMNFRNARELGALRKLYGTQIRQLERANEAMVKEAERRRLVGPEKNMLYQNIGNLDDWLEDPNRVLGSYSGTQLTNEVSAMAGAIGKSIVDRYNKGQLDNDTKLWVETNGLSRQNVDKAVAEVQQGGIANVKDPIMRNILQSAMDSSGIYNWADDATKRTAENMAARGLYGGIGQAKMGEYENKEYARQRQFDYAVRLAQRNADIEVDKARRIAALTTPNPLADGTGQTVPLHFSDKDVAGNAMKNKMADATVEFMKANPNNKYVKKIKAYWDKHGGWDKAREYWAANGFNGDIEWTGGTTKDKDFDKRNGIYYQLGNYLRKNVTKNEDLINIWRSPYELITYQSFDVSPTTGFSYPLSRPNSSSNQIKNWKNFGEAATQGYTYNGISQNDDTGKLSSYLSTALKGLTSNKQVKLYNIKNINSNGAITYDTAATSLEQMPTKDENGSKVIDTSNISRTTLPDGSWLLTWSDADGNPVQRVWRIQDMPLEYRQGVADLISQGNTIKSTKYKDNKKAQKEIDKRILQGIHQKGLDLYRHLDVEDKKR